MREMTISAARPRPAAPYIESSRIVGSDKKVPDIIFMLKDHLYVVREL